MANGLDGAAGCNISSSQKISLIVTARDEPDDILSATVDGLVETSRGRAREIIVVDDGSLVPVTLAQPEVHVIRNTQALGVQQARRRGASLATGDILVWVDAHMRFAPDWLDHMLAEAHCGALLCATWWNYELTSPVCWGADFIWSSQHDEAAGRFPGFGFRHRTECPGENTVEVPMCIGACYMMLRTTYEKIGGLSPFFRTWGMDEQDISARAWISGFGVKCVSRARVGHLTRNAFPYPVRWEDIRFNQLAMVRTVFEQETAAALEDLMKPVPPNVQKWVNETDFSGWRSRVQSARQMSDAEFFSRFIPQMPDTIKQRPGRTAGRLGSARQEKISLIITTRDETAPVLKATIDGLLTTSKGYSREIIVVDDGSLIPVIADGQDHFRVIRHDEPIGVAQSRRHGASVASGDILVWMDAHMSFDPDWLNQMTSYVDSGALFCSAFWNYELTRAICWGADFIWRQERDYGKQRWPGFFVHHRTKYPGDGAVEVPMVIGGCYMMLRRSYEKIGGFSPFFRIYGGTEQDMSARAWIMGIGAKCVTGARVGHLTRKQFPYPVHWEHLEFNQFVMVRTVFEEETARELEGHLKPIPKLVEKWLDETDCSEWRELIQSRRQISDADFFRRFISPFPDGPQ